MPVADRASLAVGLVIGVAVCFPFFHGWLLALDWVRGNSSPLVPGGFYGLKGGLTGGVPFSLIVNLLVHLLGPAGTWLPVLIVFPVGALGIGRLLGEGLTGRPAPGIPGRIAAAALFLVNPFVFDRLYAGQVALLLGYAILPFAVRALGSAMEGTGVLGASLWVAASIALSPHFAWILSLVAIAFLIARPDRARAALRLAWVAVAAGAMSAYAIISPVLAHVRPASVHSQLASYATSGDPRVGLYVNVLGLYGFWRPGPTEPKDVFAGWVLFLGAIVLLSAYGVVVAWQQGGLGGPQGDDATADSARDSRRTVLALGIAALLGYLFALGAAGPTGWLYKGMIEHVPGFAVMREPQKFLMLLALFYAWAVGRAVDQLVGSLAGRAGRIGATALAAGLALVYSPNMLGGLGGQLTASDISSSWGAARAIIGSSRAVFFPWDSYVTASFAGDRQIASPAKAFLPSTVLSSSDPGSGYSLESLTATDRVMADLTEGGYSTRHVGEMLSSIGVRYVVVAKIGDWQRYGWLGRQYRLVRVYDSSTLEVWRNEAPGPAVRLVSGFQLYRNEGDYIADPVTAPGRAPAIGRVGPGAKDGAGGNGGAGAKGGAGAGGLSSASLTGGALAAPLSPVRWRIRPSKPGYVVLPIPYQSGWQMNGRRPRLLAGGNMAVWTNGKGGYLVFTPWTGIEISYVASVATLIAVLAALVWERRRRHDSDST